MFDYFLIFLSFLNYLFLTKISSSEKITIKISSEIKNKFINLLLGVNTGPLPSHPENPNLPDLTNKYHKIGMKIIRNHDFYQGEVNFLKEISCLKN